MVQPDRSLRLPLAATAAFLLACASFGAAKADTIVLRNGTVIRGALDRDNTLAFVSDLLKRTIFYDSKIAQVVSDPGFTKLERFRIDQPLEVHAGIQPPAAVGIQATPWDEKGRRMFRYVNLKQRPVEMQQAINEFSAHMTLFRGIDGFWQGQVATSQVPRPIILGLLKLVNQADEEERLKITRWLIQAEWYDEALAALDGLARDFAEVSGMRERVADTRRLVQEDKARKTLDEVEIRRKAGQPAEVLRLLRSLPTEGLPKEILDGVRDQIRAIDEQKTADRKLGETLRDLAEKLTESDRKAWKVRIAEVLEVLGRAPEAARPRLEALTKADPALPEATRFALAMSGWVVGAESSVDQLKGASDLWRAREVARDYLSTRTDTPRPSLVADLKKVEGLDLETLAKLVVRMEPPLRDPDPTQEKPGVLKLHRAVDDDSPVPSEYAVLLPPEYHPSRSYPAVVALHDGRGPASAAEWLRAEAARRGYIVIAPEYNVPGQGKAYHYSIDEHAAAQNSLRDARKRYAIDSDRVYLAGQLEGANMALDFGLGHPDLFAGVVCISGFPAKYAYKYKPQADHLPIYMALGELAPLAREVAFDQYAKPMILDVQDVTYVDYLKRGLEALPEEVPTFFDWMDRRRRDPAPKTFEAATAREGDSRFYGVIVRDFAPGRVTSPEAADIFGKNLKPATIKMRTSVQGNLINLTTTGINRLDVWVSPKLIDFKKKAMEVRWNDRPLYKGAPRLDYEPMLEDLRTRGDRQQLYFMKVTIGAAGPRTKGR